LTGNDAIDASIVVQRHRQLSLVLYLASIGDPDGLAIWDGFSNIEVYPEPAKDGNFPYGSAKNDFGLAHVRFHLLDGLPRSEQFRPTQRVPSTWRKINNYSAPWAWLLSNAFTT
jgi:hypothetical protein